MAKDVVAEVEALETRRMLSVSVKNKILFVTGAERADRVRVEAKGKKVAVFENGRRKLILAKGIKQVRVNVKGGSDTVDLSKSPFRATILGGKGDDALTGSPFNDVIEGGDGKDRIYGLAGDDALDGDDDSDIIDGGDGNDRIEGDFDPDILYGGAGDDIIDAQDFFYVDNVIGGAGLDEVIWDDNSSAKDTVTEAENIHA